MHAAFGSFVTLCCFWSRCFFNICMLAHYAKCMLLMTVSGFLKPEERWGAGYEQEEAPKKNVSAF